MQRSITTKTVSYTHLGSGLPRDVMAKMDEFISIPHTEQVESLNAGVAASIVLYEAARQKKSSWPLALGFQLKAKG